MRTNQRTVAVIGSGVAGLVAAYTLRNDFSVTMYERDQRLGGHAHTHLVDVGETDPVPVDSGFIVHNDHTYPTLCRIFTELEVPTRDTEMSMSIRDDRHGIEYAGGKGLRGLFPSARHAVSAQHLRLLAEVPRFHRAARRLLADPGGDHLSLDEFVRDTGLSDRLVQHFLLPLVAAVWSCPPDHVGDYPAKYLFTFLDNHGMLSVGKSLQWRTVIGGSARYVEKIAANVDHIKVGVGVSALHRTATGVQLVDATGQVADYDAAVVAVHPHQALALLASPTDAEREVLGAIGYTPNPGLLHSDSSLLPRRDGARGSWNYLATDRSQQVSVTYDLSTLMGLPTHTRRVLVTLGGDDLVDPRHVIAELNYEHPTFTAESVSAAARLTELSSPTLAYAGAYHGWGFHEDGARSGLLAAQALLSGRGQHDGPR